jgi:hypothetical protein
MLFIMIHVLEIFSALCIDVIACFVKTHACSVVQEYFGLLYDLCTAGDLNDVLLICEVYLLVVFSPL